MKKFLLGFNIILIFLTGCATNKPNIPSQYVYINKPIPMIEPKPTPQMYNSYMVKFNNEDYYVMSKADFLIMQANWASFKNWAETNYNILLELKK